MNVTVAVAQYEVPFDAKESFEKLSQMVTEACKNNAKLLVLPETSVGYLASVKNNGTDYLPQLGKIAWENNIAISTSYYTKVDKSYFNQGVVINGQGKVQLNYQKIYLAQPEIDEDKISAGNTLGTARLDFGTVGMIICKDGFNKYSHYLYEKLANDHVDIICIPSWSLGIWETNTEDYIKTFYTYGSYISRSFVLVAGNLNKETKSFGRSLIINPRTGVITEGSRDKEELLVETIEIDDVKSARLFDGKWQPKKRII
jgi:predicted amidohydrolase